jgi:hypothetical protein
MERTDWLDEGLSSADARFLMLTAITHHRFSSPAWGEHEVRKLHAELAELDRQVMPPGRVDTRQRRKPVRGIPVSWYVGWVPAGKTGVVM